MKISRHLIPSLATVIVLMTGSRELLAQQQAAPLFTERFSNVFDPSSRTYFSLQGTEGKQFGGQQPFASIGATHYMGEIDSAVTLYSGQFMMNYNAITGNPAGSLGVQQRWLTDLPVLERSILGAGLYVDFTQSRYNNLFQQVNVNLELFTESAWVARANAYLPVGQIQQNTGLQSIQGGAPGQLSVVGTAVGLGGINQQWMDVALMGSDLELGRKFFNYRTEVYGGYYNWNGPLAGFANGVKGGVRSYLTNNLSGNVNVSHDQFFGTNVYGGLTYFFGGSGGSRPNSFENLMTLPAQRSQQVSIGNYVRDVSTFKPLHDSLTGDELHMYFVKENGLGAGTQANPSNVNSVLADTHFATGSAMVLLDANGNITSPIALNHDRQQIVGGGSTGTADVDFSLALGQAPGTSVVHLSNLGGRPVLAPTTGNAVTLTNQNTIQGFTIDGSGGLTNGISGNPGATDTIIRDMILQNIAGTGIKIQPSTNTTVDNVTFANNGVDLLLNAANSKISNITSTGAVNGSLNLGGSGGDITGTTLISNVNITGAGGFGGILLNNAQNGSVTNLTNVNISTGTGSGVTVTNSQTGSIYNLTNVDVLNVGGNGMSLQSSNGTFNVNGTSSITNAGTAALAINGGAINVQFDGGISQGVTGSALAVTGNHTGTVNFGAGSTINTTLGDGLQFNGADGSYTFLGTTNMNGGDAGIDIFSSNGSFVFTNPFINNTASGMGVKIVGGGGDSPITTFNGLNISTISNQGFFVSNGGLTTVNGTATVNTQFGTAFESQGTALAAVFTDITSTQSPAAGININNSSGTFGVTGTTTISGAALSGINILGSNGLTSTFQNVAISNVGTGALDNGVTLSTAGTVNILGGTINGTTGDGINSNNTNLTATGLNIGGTGTITGDGIEVVNTGTARTVNLSNNTIKANASGISTKDSGAAKELLLTLDGNTLQSLNGGSLALSVIGNGTNSTIIRSMNGGTVIGGTGGGVNFNRVTFDASGTALSGTQLDAGNWTIGTTGARVQGDGLRFDAPTGDLKYGTLNVANNSGTGLYVNTKTLGTTFALSNSSGGVNTTGGAALFLDPLTTNLTFGTVSSTNSTTNGATIDTVTGSLNINQFTVNGADGSGLLIQNSSGLTSIIQNLAITTVGTTGTDNGVTLSNAGNVSLLVGSIQGTTGDGIHSTDTNLTINGIGVVGGSIAGDALQIVNTTGSHTASVANSALYGGTSALTTSDSGSAGGLILSLDNNTYLSTGVGSVALNVTGSGLNSTIIKSMNGGTVFSGGSANFNRVTFDASGAALSGTQVNAGNWTFGGTTRLNGDGLNLTSTTGNLQFGNLIINNDGGTGLLVDTKTLGTTFTLGSTGGSIDTVNGAAMSLDPLTTNLSFQSVTSVNSTSNGITLDTVGGTVNLGTVNITNAAGSGLSMDNSTAAVIVGQLNVNGAVDGLLFGTNTGGSFTATGTTTLSNVTGSGINLQGATGAYNFADLNITSLGAFTGLDFRNSNVLFTSGNTTITGNGAAGSIGIDLSGSTNPNGANSTTSNIHLANGAGQTAIINNVDTGVLLGNVVDGSAGAYLVYGNQTALNSGSQINVTPSGLTLDTTNLTSTNGYTQGRYEFLGVAFTGIASFQKSNDLIFVGSTSSGTDDGSSPLNRISAAQLLALDATPSNLDGKTVVLVNDNGGVGINLGANTLTLGDNTILDSFGNGQTFSTNGVLPVNVIVDTISGNVVYSDPNGAAKLTNNGSMNLVTLGNGDTVQNLLLSGGTNTIFGSGIAGANINNNTITGSSLAGISLTNTTGAIGITQNAIRNTGGDGILLTNAGAVSVNGGIIDGTGGDGIHSSDTNLTATNVNIGGSGTITGDGIEIVNGGSAHVVNLSNNTIKANASGISTVDSGNPGELVLTLDGNTLQSLGAGSKALSVLGGGLNSTIVTSMNGGTVFGGANSGGVVFNRVTFDASGAALSGTQVTAGIWTIGDNGARVQGDGLRFDGTTGNLAFTNLNISNNAGTGLYVDTKSLGTTFALNNTSGSIDTTSGSALFLDPLTTNMTFATVTSANSAGAGMTLDAVSGSLIIGTLNVSNSAGDGVYIHNSTGAFNINGGSITGALGDSFHVDGGSANVTYDGSITSSAGRVAYINGTTGGGVTFGGLLSGEGPGQGIRATSNAGNVTFNGDVSLGAATALSNEAVYLTNNTGNIKFGNLDVHVNTLTALGAVYGTNNSLVTIGGGNVTSAGTAALNFDLSKIDITLSSITASGGTDGLDLTNLASGSILNSTTTTITGVEQTGVKLTGSQGSYNLGTLDINGARTGINFRNSNLSFTAANTTITGDGSPNSVAVDLSGTQNPNGANSTTPNIQIANAVGQTAIINNFGTGIRMGNVPDGSAGAYFIYGNQTPLNSGSQINVINGGLTLDGTHLTSTDPYTQGRYEFKGVSFTGNTSFPIGGTQLLFVGSVSSGAATGADPNNRISLAQLLALDSTPSNLDNLTVVLVNDSGTGGGAADLNMAANTLTLGTNTILDSFGNGQTFTSSGPIVPVNVIVDTLGAVKYTDPFGNGAAILTNNGSLNLVTLGNNDTVQNVILTGGQDQVFGSGVSGVNVNHTTFNGLPGGSAIHLVNTTGTISLDSNSISNSGNSGILLSNAGAVSITGGTIDNTSLHGIESINTDLTVDGVTFGGTLGLAGAGVSITNNDATNRTVNLTNLISSATSNIGLQGIVINSSGTGTLTANLSGNSIAATQSGLLVNETAGVAATDTVRLNLTGTNTWQSGTSVYAVDINGQNIDASNSSIVITSLGNGTITGNGTGGGVHFNNVGFDSDLGTVGNQQVAAGTWNIGQGTLAGQRVAGDGLRFDGSTGDVGFSTLNIYNDNGTGLYVDTKTVGTTFNLGTGGGSIDTTNGSAMFLDPLTTAMTLGSVTSTNASGDAVTFDTVGGVIAIGSLNISGAGGSGLLMSNSSGLTSTFTTVDISSVGTLVEDNGITLSDAGTVKILGGTINGTTGNAILSQDTNLTATGLNIGGTGTISGDGIGIGNTGTGSTYTVDISNNTIKSAGLAITSIDSGSAADLVLTLDGNTIQSTGSLAMNITGSGFNSTIIQSMNGGTVVGNGAGGGVLFQRVTFDASGAALTGTQVNAGDWTIGTVANRVSGDALQIYDPTGDLTFGALNIANNTGTGLYVNTKNLGTTFTLGNTSGTIDTTNGQAVYLDPLTTSLTFDAINSTGSFTNGITLDTVAGTFTVNGGTITDANNSDIAIANSSATVNLNGMTLNTNGNTGVTLNGNSGPVTFTDLGMVRTAGDTAFDIDASVASTGKITIDGGSSLGSAAGTAFLIGAGSRDIDATAVNITNSLTTTGPVISITGQSGGTIGFGDITNSGTTATNIIATTGQTAGTVNFGTVSITGFGDASTDTAISLSGTGGTVNFTDLDITTTNGGGLNVGGITFAAGSTPTIDATGGTALTLNGTTLAGGAETFDSITANGGVNGISLTNVTGATTFTTVAITSTTGSGILLSSGGTVIVNGGTIDGTADDGIHSSDTDLTVNGVTLGGTIAIVGDGIEIVNNGSAHVVNLSNNSITADASGISTVDGGNAGELLLTLDNNTLQSLNAGSRAMSILGGGPNSTIIRSMNGGTVIGGVNSGGVFFSQVTFDASGTALLGTQVAAGDWTIGTNAARVQGDGLRFDGPTGDLAFGNLNVSNNNGTGVYVDTKTLGTTFNLANAGGTVDTTSGAALFLDPLSVNMTFASVASDGSGDNGVWLDGLSGSFTVTGATTVTNAGLNGILIENSSGSINFGNVNIDTTGADGVHINNNTGTIDFNGTTTIQNTTGDGIDEASAGGGVTFGVTSISSAGANGINLSTATGSYTFGATTINGFGTNKVGVNFVGANAAATFGVTDIQNGGSGTGIDLSSTTGNKVITFATGSNISNVALGVELSSSHTTATTANANFSFGDGSLPTGSTINATTTVNAIGLNAASGTYNFVDVAFTGSASLPGGAGSALFVSATAVNGVGDGSFSNPYSVADADAVATTGAKFVFLDGTYDFNSLNGGQAFTLAKNQSVEGFDNGNTVIYGTVQPANISGNLGASGGIASRTGSLSITDSAANGIFDLAGGNSLLDITLTGSAATTYLVNANSATVGFDNTNGISLNGVTMSNPAGSATALQFTNLSGNVVIDGNNISLASGRLLDINGGTASYSFFQGTQPDVGSTPGVLAGPSIRVRNTTGGSLMFDKMSLSGTGTLVTLDNNDATFQFDNSSFAGGIGSTLFDIDTGTGGSTTALTFDASNSITQARGTIATIGTGARDIDLSLFNFNNINTTNANVIKSVGQTGGTIKFGTIGISNYNNVAGTAVSLTGTGGTVTFGDLDITTANGNGLNVGAITFDGGISPTISTLNGSGLVMSGTTLLGGSELFSTISSTGGANGVSLTNITGATTITSVNISGSTGDGIALSNAGTVILNGGTIDGTGGDGIHSSNTDLTVSGMLIGGTTATTGDGLQVVNNISHTLAIDNTTVTSATGAGITVDGMGGGTTTVTSFNGNTVSNAGAGGVLFNGVTFDATPGGAVQQVTGGNLTIGSLVTTTNVTGDGLVMNNVLGDIAFGTLNIGNDNGTGLYIRDAAGKVGSFAFTNSGGTINTTNGAAIDIDPVTMNSTFTSVTSTNANGQGASAVANGIYLNTITGSVTINAGSITGATGGSFAVDGGNAAIVYGGNITNTAGRLVSVANTTGGSVTFGAAGTLTDSGTAGNTGTGILLSNVAGNVSFNGSTALTNSDSTGVDIQGGSGTFTFGTGTTITSATGIDFNVNGGTSSVTYSGGMTQALNNVALVNVQGGHNTGTLTFQTGTLDATTGTGLQFNNADGIYNFNGTTTLHGGDAGVDIVNGSGGTFVFGTGTTITSPTGTAFNMDSSTAGVTFSGNITQANNASLVGISNETGGTVTFQTGTLSATNGNGIQLSNADNTVNFNGTTTLNGGNAGVDILSGSAGSFTFGTGTTITSPSGAAFNMDSSSAGVTFSGNITQANNAALVSISNESTGTVTFQTGTLSATNGTGIQLSNADNTINFNGTTTLNGGDAGIDIVSGSSGTITFGTGTTVTNPTGLPYNEDTSTANVTFNGSITKTSSSNSAININAKTGGTTSFNGLVTATTGATNAISLTSNSGGTINFANNSGTSNITTTSGNGFNFTGGGSLNVTGNNYVVSSTSGTTFNATAGTVTATGTGNTVASTTGRAVNINGATIGGSGVTFRSVSANGGTTSAILLSGTGAGNFTVTGDGTAAAGAQGGNASGGTIQNITGVDAISLNNVSGTVSLNSMSILNITASTDASDAKQTLSGVDAIQGTGTIGGLSLVGVKISNTSDMAVNGASGVNWGGLTINNSLLEKSNRFGVSGKGDDNNEGMVQILGITGTASVTNSKFDQGARLLDLQTGTSGNLNVTATNNTFSNSWKGFDSAGDSIYFIGGDAVRILTQGSATATVIIGDQNQSNSALGNVFLNDKYSLLIGHMNSTDTGLIKTTISENNFQVTNHKSPTGSPLFNYPNGTVMLLGKGVGGLNANVSRNTFDQLTDNQGLFGSLNVAAENGTTQVRINNNTFIKPWDHSMHLRTNNSATLTAEINNNTYVTGSAGGAGTDSVTFNGPYDNIWIQSIGSSASTVNVTIHDEALPTNTNSANDLEFTTAAAGQTMNVFLYNLTAPKGYKFNASAAGGTINLYRNGSVAGTVAGILSDNNVTGGGGSTATDPPTVSIPGAGTVQGTNSVPLLPSFTVP